VTDPVGILRVVLDHPVLLCSETSFVFYPLRDLGYVEYGKGRWHVTDAGRQAAGEWEPEPTNVASFFGLGGT